MKKYLVLSEDTNSLTISNSSGTIISAIQYVDIEQCTKVVFSEQTKERLPNMSEYIVLRMVSGKEIKLNFQEVLSPDYEDIDEMYADIYSWIFGSTPPTPAP
jgi:hypothetical protein